ncbi:MAG: hypothetical protein WCF04_09220 [Candidatus Nanopelagicales bacterium]
MSGDEAQQAFVEAFTAPTDPDVEKPAAQDVEKPADLDDLRAAALYKAGLPATFANRLTGDTAEQLEADARDLADLLGHVEPTPPPKPPLPPADAVAGPNANPTTPRPTAEDLFVAAVESMYGSHHPRTPQPDPWVDVDTALDLSDHPLSRW